MSTQTLDEIFGFAPKKRTTHPLDEVFGTTPSYQADDLKSTLAGKMPQVSEKEALKSAGLTSGMDPLKDAGKDVGRFAIGSVYDPSVQMGLGVANTAFNPLLGRETIQNLPSFANLTGDASAPNIAAPGYDQQGNYIGKLKAAEQMVGATGMTALNVGTAGRGSSVANMVAASPLGKYAIGKTTPVVSRMLGASAREGTVGAGYGATSAMSEGEDVGGVLKSTAIGTGIGVAGGATLAAGSSALGKLGGVSEKLVDDAINLERAGDKVGAAAARATPGYQQFIKANNLTDAEIIKKTDLQLAELKKFEDEGIGRSRSASTAGKQARKQNKIQDEQRGSFVKYARESSEATDANIADNSQFVGNSRQEVLDAAKASKVEIMPMNERQSKNFVKKVKSELSANGVYGEGRENSINSLTRDLDFRIAQAKQEGRSFDITDYYNFKTSANKSFGGTSNGDELATAVGNVIRRDLKTAGANATNKETKAIIEHLVESDNQLSSLKQAGEYNKFLQTLGQGRASRLLNLFAGFGLSGGNPVAGIGIAMMTQNIQQRVLASRGNRIYRGLTGKIKGGTTDELIGNTANVIKMIKGKKIEGSQERSLAKALASMTREYKSSLKKEEIDRVSKLLRLPARATPAPTQLGGRNYLNQKIDNSGKVIGQAKNIMESAATMTEKRNLSVAKEALLKQSEIDRVSKLLRLPARATPAPTQLGGRNYLNQKIDNSGKLK